jgi:hypothetical protein
MGPQQRRKVLTLQTLPASENPFGSARVAQVSGFSLHAGVTTEAYQREKLERLCLYITRSAVSEKRLSLTNLILLCPQWFSIITVFPQN